MRADVFVVGGSFGGVAAELTAARIGRTVILTEETGWFGGQATTQGVPLDWPAGHRQIGGSFYSHHNVELKDIDTFCFGEAARL